MQHEMNCTRMVDMDPKIALRNNWSYLSSKIRSGFREGDAASGRVIIAGGHGFEPSTRLSKSYPNGIDMNWSRHAE